MPRDRSGATNSIRRLRVFRVSIYIHAFSAYCIYTLIFFYATASATRTLLLECQSYEGDAESISEYNRVGDGEGTLCGRKAFHR